MQGHPPGPAGDLIEDLRRVLGSDAVLVGDARARYAVQGSTPAVVALPRSADAVSAALATAAAHDAAVAPWGGGTRQMLGLLPARCDLVLSLEHLAQVLSYDPADLTITCQAGITHAALDQVLAPAHQMLPLDVPIPERATIGGTLATATAGLRRGAFGTPRDLTLGLRVVDAGGTQLKTGGRVVKNVTGYDMTRLYIGSLGTLGVIVEASFKLAPCPEGEISAIGIFGDQPAALAAAEALCAMGCAPSAVALMHAHALPDVARLAPARGEPVLVAVRVPGSIGAVARASTEVEALLRAHHAAAIVPLHGDDQTTFWSTATDFARLAEFDDQSALLRVATQPSDLGALVGEARVLTDAHALSLTWVADAVAGVVWLRVRAPAAASARQVSAAAFGDALAAVDGALLAHWPSTVVLACAPALKSRLALWGGEPPGLALMREIKETFDPARRLNPGRFLTGL